MSASSFLLALDMFRSKCIFYFIYIFSFSALQHAHGCGAQLPVVQGWYIASPMPPQVNYYSPPIRKVHQEPMETLSFGPMCMVPPFLPYPYEIFHVQRIIQPSEDVQFPEGIEQYEIPTYEAVEVEGEEEDVDVSYAPATGETEDMRSTPYPENYYLPHHVVDHHQLSMATAVTASHESEDMDQSLPPEEPEDETEDMDPHAWTHYLQAYKPQYETEPVVEEERTGHEEVTQMVQATETTEAPCHVEQTTIQEEISESTPMPEVQQVEPVASASAMSQHQQVLLNQMHEEYETEEEVSPCDGYFEKNAATLAQMLEQHFDQRHVRGSRSEGSEHADGSRLFTPIVKALKNIIGSFMTMADKPQGKPNDSEPVTTEKPELPKLQTTVKPAEVPTPTTQRPQETQSATTPEPESGATETPKPEVEKEGDGA